MLTKIIHIILLFTVVSVNAQTSVYKDEEALLKDEAKGLIEYYEQLFNLIGSKQTTATEREYMSQQSILQLFEGSGSKVEDNLLHSQYDSRYIGISDYLKNIYLYYITSGCTYELKNIKISDLYENGNQMILFINYQSKITGYSTYDNVVKNAWYDRVAEVNISKIDNDWKLKIATIKYDDYDKITLDKVDVINRTNTSDAVLTANTKLKALQQELDNSIAEKKKLEETNKQLENEISQQALEMWRERYENCNNETTYREKELQRLEELRIELEEKYDIKVDDYNRVIGTNLDLEKKISKLKGELETHKNSDLYKQKEKEALKNSFVIRATASPFRFFEGLAQFGLEFKATNFLTIYGDYGTYFFIPPLMYHDPLTSHYTQLAPIDEQYFVRIDSLAGTYDYLPTSELGRETPEGNNWNLGFKIYPTNIFDKFYFGFEMRNKSTSWLENDLDIYRNELVTTSYTFKIGSSKIGGENVRAINYYRDFYFGWGVKMINYNANSKSINSPEFKKTSFFNFVLGVKMGLQFRFKKQEKSLTTTSY